MTELITTPTKAKVLKRDYIDCPHCGKDSFDVTGHKEDVLDAHPIPLKTVYTRRCDHCHYKVSIKYDVTDETYYIVACTPSLDTYGYSLLKFVGNSTKPLWIVVKSHLYHDTHAPQSKEEQIEHQRYWVDEHTCPTNIIDVALIVYGTDPDPHGVFKFVAFASEEETIAQGFDPEDPNNDHLWFNIFPQMLGESPTVETTVFEDAGGSREVKTALVKVL